MIGERLEGFKAYDVRGRVPEDLNEEMAYDIGRAYVAEIKPEGVVAVGRDVRETSVILSAALVKGISDGGVDVLDIGLCGTEMVYFGSSLPGMGGGIMVTASHNPKNYNGMKMVRAGGVPISADTGLMEIEERVRKGNIPAAPLSKGKTETRDIMPEFSEKIRSFVNMELLRPLKLLVNAGNGCAGPTFDSICEGMPFDVVKINWEPDGSFPAGIPNPLLIENRDVTAHSVVQTGAEMGIAWDGDYDRCFFFDENGNFIEGYYIVGFLAKRILGQNPGSSVVHDPRLTWNTIDIVKSSGGKTVLSKSGHSFIKETMRKTGAVYGGEMSAHHYFRDFTYSDSGMIPWLLVAEEMSTTGKKLSELVSERIKLFPCSGEINMTVSDPDMVFSEVENIYKKDATEISYIDGISMEFGRTWRFNLRKSNTEPVVRLNVESWGDNDLMKEKTDELVNLVKEA